MCSDSEVRAYGSRRLWAEKYVYGLWSAQPANSQPRGDNHEQKNIGWLGRRLQDSNLRPRRGTDKYLIRICRSNHFAKTPVEKEEQK